MSAEPGLYGGTEPILPLPGMAKIELLRVAASVPQMAEETTAGLYSELGHSETLTQPTEP